MTIQSTCHPHSQAASSSLLTNEGGGVGEADTEGGGRGGQTHRCKKKRQRGQVEGQVWGGGRDRPGEGQRARLEPSWRPDGEARREDEQAQQRPGAGLGAWAQGDGPPGLPSEYLQSSQETDRGRAGPAQGKGRARQAGPGSPDGAQTPPGWSTWAPEAGLAPTAGRSGHEAQEPCGSPGYHLCSHPSLELAFLATLLALQPRASSLPAGTC